jgi:ABC-type lipoprotein export system ATPase subunit/bifunctional DNA-binding transcriptional regulator/antitoxin component of YhaV-PrlF toxin-antitoxin module
MAAEAGAPPEAGAPYIRCEDLFKIYKSEDLEVVALRGLDLEVRRGEMMAIVGASGSGKSTLLNILAGLDQPSAGAVTVGARDLLTTPAEELVGYRRSEVGFVWQQTGRNLIPYLAARENVEVPLILEGASPGAARARASELLREVGLADKEGRRPDQLSGGEQQRVAIAVALANDPPLLLADEPTGELDSATAEEVFAVFRRLNEATGVTVVIVTHDASIIANVDRVVAMRDGRASTEVVRRTRFTREHELDVDEYALVDRSGRVQIPREFAERLGLGARARVSLEGDHVEVRADAPDEEAEAEAEEADAHNALDGIDGDAASEEAASEPPVEDEPPADWSRPAGPPEPGGER